MAQSSQPTLVFRDSSVSIFPFTSTVRGTTPKWGRKKGKKEKKKKEKKKRGGGEGGLWIGACPESVLPDQEQKTPEALVVFARDGAINFHK